MTTTPDDIERTVLEFLERVEKRPADFTRSTPLYADGAGLDSLDTAELSATLEDVHGLDPFAGDTMPETVQDIIDYFAVAHGS